MGGMKIRLCDATMRCDYATHAMHAMQVEGAESSLGRTIFVRGVTPTQVLQGAGLRTALSVLGSIAQVASIA